MSFSNSFPFWTIGLAAVLTFALAFAAIAIFKYRRRKADEKNVAPYFDLQKRLADIDNSTVALQASYMESRRTA